VKPAFLIAWTSLWIGPFVATVEAGVGGFREISITDKVVLVAANYAIDARGKIEKVVLSKILKAEVQVVAGRNFRILMEIHGDEGIRKAQATVWVGAELILPEVD
jgi:hypothetical protein